MAGKIKEGQSVYIPFVYGESALDSHFSTRVYKSPEQFEKSYHDGGDPTLVEYAPVVHEKWVDKPTGRYGRMQSWCTACGKHSGIGGIKKNRHKPYCPNCGAKMDLEAADE